MIHINLHNYRKELEKIEIQKRLLKSISIVGMITLLLFANWMVSQIKLDKIKGETQKLEKTIKILDPQVKAIQKMQSSQKRKMQIVGEIDSLRGKQFPVSKIINDLNLAVPSGVWLDSVAQMTAQKLEEKKVPVIIFGTPTSKNKKGEKNEKTVNEFIEITGKALDEESIAKYIKNLQGIPYYKIAFLHKSTLTIIGDYPIYSFKAYSYLPEDKKEKGIKSYG